MHRLGVRHTARKRFTVAPPTSLVVLQSSGCLQVLGTRRWQSRQTNLPANVQARVTTITGPCAAHESSSEVAGTSNGGLSAAADKPRLKAAKPYADSSHARHLQAPDQQTSRRHLAQLQQYEPRVDRVFPRTKSYPLRQDQWIGAWRLLNSLSETSNQIGRVSHERSVQSEREWAAKLSSSSMIDEPVTAAQKAFLSQVEALTTARPRQIRRTASGGPSFAANVDDAARKLVQLFHSTERLSQVASTSAVRLAIAFLANARKSVSRDDIIWTFADKGLRIPIELFNSLLKNVALDRFTTILQVMKASNTRANGRTWAIFAGLVYRSSHDLFTHVLECMERNGQLADPLTKQAVARISLSRDLVSHVENDPNGNVRSFIRMHDKKWAGPDWVSHAAICKMAHAVALLGRSNWLQILYDVSSNRGLLVDVQVLNNILSGLNLHSYLEPAIQSTVELLEKGIKLDDHSFDHLFQMAWRRRYANVCRVLWTHACISGHVSSQMQHSMKRAVCLSLPRDVFTTESTSQQTRAHEAIDMEDSLSKLEDHEAATSESDTIDEQASLSSSSRNLIFRSVASKAIIDILRARADEIESIVQSTPSEEDLIRLRTATLDSRCSSLKDVVESDMALVGRYRATGSFAQELAAAYALDREWKRSGLTRDWRAMVDGMMCVELVPIVRTVERPFRLVHRHT